ncbi:S41 family peptidase [Brevundimonas staleyi]|uniref:S41 family peptidase n=1 Tax=Brevundimonas staleyi TaxID=74326 RepID=A0ABW0FXX7_9CAUL
MTSLRRLGLIAAATLFLGGCQTFLPYSDDERRMPTVVEVEDGSPERLALNTRVYDSAVDWVSRRFYKRDFGGVDWPGETAARRDEALAQPTERGFYRALNETLDLLGDRHTNAVTPTRHAEMVRGRREPTINLGFGMRLIDDQLIVTSIRGGGPADLAGVQRGWVVESLNGEPATRESRMNREREDQLVVFVDSQDVRHELAIRQGPLPPYVGRAIRRPDGVLILSFDYFGEATRRWFDEQMDLAVADPPKGIVLDFRDNRGGLITDVGRALGHFYTERQPYAYVEYGFLPRFPIRAKPARRPWTGPVAVVIGDASASGAEVFAATFQETGRGLVFGATSMGAVVASRQLNLPDGGELSIGVRSFRSGAGRTLEGVGVVPDHEVHFRADELRRGHDAMIEAAVEAVLQNPSPLAGEGGSRRLTDEGYEDADEMRRADAYR